ncbi:MAG: hypothetical protein LUE08_04080 [Akkermansiaceae bacterium]|nr:hypothetical protein [Akkermansiaceae bacterium]
MNKPYTDEQLRLERERVILKEGVSDAALELLKEKFQFGLPVFQFRAGNLPISADAQTLALQAAVRDGEHGVINYIELVRSRPPLNHGN